MGGDSRFAGYLGGGGDQNARLWRPEASTTVYSQAAIQCATWPDVSQLYRRGLDDDLPTDLCSQLCFKLVRRLTPSGRHRVEEGVVAVAEPRETALHLASRRARIAPVDVERVVLSEGPASRP